jgi:hypothetical protein
MVSVLGLQVQNEPWRQWIFFMGEKIHCTPSFGRVVKTQAPCCKILQHVKSHLHVWTEILHKAKFSVHSPIPPACYQMSLLVGLPESSCEQVKSFLCRHHHSTMVLHAHISLAGWTIGPLKATVQRHSLTPSTWSASSSRAEGRHFEHLQW